MARNSEDLIAGLVADLKPVTPLRQAAGMRLALLALCGGVIGMIALSGLRADLLAGQPDGLALLGAGLYLVLALGDSGIGAAEIETGRELICALLSAVRVLLLFSSAVLGAGLDLLALAIFAGSLLSLIVSLALFIFEMNLSLRAIQEELLR